VRTAEGGDDGGVADTSVSSASSLKSRVGTSKDGARGALGEVGGELGGDGGGGEVGVEAESLATLVALVSPATVRPSACRTASHTAKSGAPRGGG
jgi:hypothetical protein